MARTRRSLLAAALLAVLAGATACSGDSVKPKPKATVNAPEEKADDSQEEMVDEGENTLIVALDEPAEWRNGVTATLSKFGRGTSSSYASPPDAPYLKFTVSVKNGDDRPLDLSLLTLACPEGGEEVFDSESNLDGAPASHVLPGESSSWTAACPFAPEHTDVQIEITPYDSDPDAPWYRTAIFKGEVK